MQGSITLDFDEDANVERKYACSKDLQCLRPSWKVGKYDLVVFFHFVFMSELLNLPS